MVRVRDTVAASQTVRIQEHMWDSQKNFDKKNPHRHGAGKTRQGGKKVGSRTYTTMIYRKYISRMHPNALNHVGRFLFQFNSIGENPYVNDVGKANIYI